MFYKFAGSGAAEVRFRDIRLRVFRMNAPNTSVLLPGSPGNGVFEFIRDPGRMLDKFAVKIHHVEATVGAGRREHAVEPGIGRGKEIFSNFSAFGDEGSAVRHKAAALKEVVHRFANEKVATIPGAERVAAIDGRAA